MTVTSEQNDSTPGVRSVYPIRIRFPTRYVISVIGHADTGVKAFLWVGDLTGYNFYQDNKSLQRRKMGEHGITINPLDTHGDKRLENGLCYMVKSMKSYTNLISFFKQGGINRQQFGIVQYTTIPDSFPLTNYQQYERPKLSFKIPVL